MNQLPRRSRGFATFVAVMLMGLAAMAILAMASKLSYDARRTRDAGIDAQLRQMLLAATTQAQAKLGEIGADGQPWQLTLPAELTDGTVLVVGRRDAQGIVTEMSATLRGRALQQTIRWTPSGPGWRLLSVDTARE